MKKRKKHSKIPIKTILIFCALDIFLLFWIITLVNHSDGYTESDYYFVSGQFELLYLNEGGKRTAVYFEVNGEKYRLTWYAGDRYAPSTVEKIIQDGAKVTIAVLDKRTLHSLVYGYKNAIDIRSDSIIYYDMKATNHFIASGRPAGIIAWSLIALLSIGIRIIIILLLYPEVKNARKKHKPHRAD